MSCRLNSTDEFFRQIVEVERLVELAKEDSFAAERSLFLKLSIVSLVTKFQVFVERSLEEFVYLLHTEGVKSSSLPLHIKMNAIRLGMLKENELEKLAKHKRFTEEARDKVVNFLHSMRFIYDDDSPVEKDFLFNTKFPLGKTGIHELENLFYQINGDKNIFEGATWNDEVLDMGKLNSMLFIRHSIVHTDVFNGSDVTVQEYIVACKKLVEFINAYIVDFLQQVGVSENRIGI